MIKYLGFKDHLNIPTSYSEDPAISSYRATIADLDGLFCALEDYFDPTNPRLRILFPELSYNPVPKVKSNPVQKSDLFLIMLKTGSIAQKLFTLSNFSQNLLATWYLSSASWKSPWDDEDCWIFEQDLSDVILSFLQNIGSLYFHSEENYQVIQDLISGAKVSLLESRSQLLAIREKIPLEENLDFIFWLKFQDFELDSYFQILEFLGDFLSLCKSSNKVPLDLLAGII